MKKTIICTIIAGTLIFGAGQAVARDGDSYIDPGTNAYCVELDDGLVYNIETGDCVSNQGLIRLEGVSSGRKPKTVKSTNRHKRYRRQGNINERYNDKIGNYFND